MPVSRRVAVLLVLLGAAVAPASAAGAPPTLQSAGHVQRHPDVRFSAPFSDWVVVYVSRRPDRGSDGSFFSEHIVDTDILTAAEIATGRWLSSDPLEPGTYYVAVKASPDFDRCYRSEQGDFDPACADGFSGILPLTIPRPAPPKPKPAPRPLPALVIRSDTHLGRYAVKRHGTLDGARRAFGTPTALRRTSHLSCAARWRPLGLAIGFYNLGGRDACSPQYGYFASATMTGRRWRTSSGLAIGDPFRLLHVRYRRAEPRAGGWWWLIVRSTRREGRLTTEPGLEAKVVNGRVVAFRVRYPAGGD